jgi:predicted transcriptional regulator YheO
MVTTIMILSTAREILHSGTLHDAARTIPKAIVELYREQDTEISYDQISVIADTLDEIGFFELRYAVDSLAKALGVTKQTIYTHRTN